MPSTTPTSDRIRDLDQRITLLHQRLTAGQRQPQNDPLVDQVIRVNSKVDDLCKSNGRIANLLSRMDLLEAVLTNESHLCSGEDLDQTLLLEEDRIREESVYYKEIKKHEHLLDKNHLSDSVDTDLTERTAMAESLAKSAAQIRRETDTLMQAFADMSCTMAHVISDLNKRK